RGRDFDGNQVNWPIPRTVLFNFVSAMALEGGAINYVRDDTPIPPFMDFLPDDGQGNPTRSDFAAQGIPSPFKEVLEIQEDLEIIQHSLWDVFGEFDDGGQGQEDLNPPLGQPDEEFFEDGHNFEDEHDAGVEFEDRIDSIISNITGDLSEDEVEAMIHVLLEPDIHQ
ncbi:MAG: hypothetical protein QF886_10405, partial [Planctomycetota bacterium]|nr:hypothetical protein [Planctomycetota bacterium]